ncbi:hypothetical protein YPPY47_3009, partial [Yersinia pestis PY-47]
MAIPRYRGHGCRI